MGEKDKEQEMDERFMRLALAEAEEAYDQGEIPIGAVIVSRGQVIARGHNQTERLTDVTAHAEMIAITSACTNLGGKYPPECTLYVTVEPCAMCAGALGWSQIGRIVYGAPDAKRGYESYYSPRRSPLHPKTEIKGGVLEEECRTLMVNFFKELRK
jgi:tRNA(adenine34) deaminase